MNKKQVYSVKKFDKINLFVVLSDGFVCQKCVLSDYFTTLELTEEQKASNREKSKTRSRIEHIFGYITRFMGGIYIRTIGKNRAEREICGMNLAYNLKRVSFLVASKKIPAIA